MEHLLMTEKMGKDNFVFVTVMTDGNLQSNRAKLVLLCFIGLQNACFANMAGCFFFCWFPERVNFL